MGNGHGHSHGREENHNDAESTGGVGLVIAAALFIHKAPEAAGFGTFLIQMSLSKLSLISYIGAYAIASPISAFIAYTVFAGNNRFSIDACERQETLNWWCGYTLLIAVGTLTYITLLHILREVYLEGGHDDLCHFKGEANDANASYNDDEK